jgi:hypothetical protein
MSLFVVIFTSTLICVVLLVCLFKTLQKNKQFYKSDTKISVILLSHNCPKNLKKSIPILVRYKNIDEIIILHSNPKNFVKSKNKKIKNIDDSENNKKYFALRRFIYSEKCKNNTILFLDDDIIPSRQLLLKILTQYDENPLNCFGVISRLCDKTGYHTVSVKTNIVLTPILLSSKGVFTSVWEGMKSEHEKLKEVIEKDGNTEDIYFHYMFQKIYEQKPIVVQGKYRYLNKRKRYSVNNPLKNIKIRGDFCRKLYKDT